MGKNRDDLKHAEIDRRVFDQQFPGPVLGIDEVGLGCIAGPIFVCGVVLPKDRAILDALAAMGLKDSKRLSETKREALHEFMMSQWISHEVVQISPKDVSRFRPTQCLRRATRKVCARFFDTVSPKTVLLDGDGYPLRGSGYPFRPIIKGDDKSLAIGAASVIAKVRRDRLMCELALEFPGYLWEKNKGYATKAHLEGIDHLGVTPHHRTNTAPVQAALRGVNETREPFHEEAS